MATLRLDQIHRDGGTLMRARLNRAVILDYAERYHEKLPMPPPVVFYDGKQHWLADGHHRTSALDLVLPEGALIEVDLRRGTLRDAILYAASANEEHGLRRTREDRCIAVATLLRDDGYRQLSDREVGRLCKVDPHLVAEVRTQLVTSGEIPQVTERKGKDNKTRRLPKRTKDGQGAAAGALIGKRPGVEAGDPAELRGVLPGGAGGGKGDAGADRPAAQRGRQDRRDPDRAALERELAADRKRQAEQPIEDRIAVIRGQVRAALNACPEADQPALTAALQAELARGGLPYDLRLKEAAAEGYGQGQGELLIVVAGWLGISTSSTREEIEDRCADLRQAHRDLAELRRQGPPDSRAIADAARDGKKEGYEQALMEVGAELGWETSTLVTMASIKEAIRALLEPTRQQKECEAHSTPPEEDPFQDLLTAAKKLGGEHGRTRRRPLAGKGDELLKCLRLVGEASWAGKVLVPDRLHETSQRELHDAYLAAFRGEKASRA